MRPRRIIAALLVFLLVGGLVGGTLAYGIYYRSDRYRSNVQQHLSDFFGLPTAIAGIEPHTFSSRRLMGVRMWLPERRALIFQSPHIVWLENHDPDDGGVRIDIYDADLTIDSVSWQREDYARVLRASLAHNFGQLDIREVRYHDARIVWARHDVRLVAEGVQGILRFQTDGRGQGHFTCHRLNGASVTEPVQITAAIDPHTSELLPDVVLLLPRLALKELDLNSLLASEITQGTFAGKVQLRQTEGAAEVEISGAADDILLQEFTSRVPHGPYPAKVDLTIERILLRDSDLVALKFNGEFRDIDVNPILAQWGLPRIGGSANLTIHNGRFADNRLIWLLAEGEWSDASVEQLATALLQRGGINGRLRVTLNDLKLDHRGIAGGDVNLLVIPEPGQKGHIDRDLLAELLEKALGFTLPEMLRRWFPQRMEYVQIGAHLLILPDHIQVRAAEGPEGPAIITARMQERNIPLLGDLNVAIPTHQWIQRIKERANELESQVRQRLHPPSSP